VNTAAKLMSSRGADIGELRNTSQPHVIPNLFAARGRKRSLTMLLCQQLRKREHWA
jgi:hypothetical protein